MNHQLSDGSGIMKLDNERRELRE